MRGNSLGHIRGEFLSLGKALVRFGIIEEAEEINIPLSYISTDTIATLLFAHILAITVGHNGIASQGTVGSLSIEAVLISHLKQLL